MIDILQAIDERISCRSYSDRPVETEKLDQLQAYIDSANAEAGLHIQLYGPTAPHEHAITMSSSMFAGTVDHYAAFVCAADDLSMEKLGFYGEKIVLLATQLGLGTCWVASTYDKSTCRADIAPDEKLHIVVPIGYAMEKTPLKQRTIRAGIRARNRKPESMITSDVAPLPQWLVDALAAVVKAPSAINAQPVDFSFRDGQVTASIRTHKIGLETIDLGIAKLHFQLGSGSRGTWEWGDGATFTCSRP